MDNLGNERLKVANGIAQYMASLYDETDDNPEYYRGMLDLGASLLGGDMDVARDALDAMVNLVRELS